MDPTRIAQHLAYLQQVGLLGPANSPVPGEVSFRHALIQEAAYHSLLRADRKHLHATVVTSLEDLAPGAPESRAPLLAYHALASGKAAPAFRYSVLAGDSALRQFAVRSALIHYEQALALLTAPGADPALAAPADRAQLYSHLGRAYELIQDRAAARVMYEKLLATTRAAGDVPAESQTLSRLALLTAHESMGVADAGPLLAEAERLAAQSGDRRLLAEIGWTQAQMSIYKGDAPAIEAYGQRALIVAHTEGAGDLEARILNALTYGNTFQGDWAAALDRATRSADLFAQFGNRALELDSRNLQVTAQVVLGATRAALATGETALAQARATENPWNAALLLMAIALARRDLGDYQGAYAAGIESLALCRTHDLIAVRVMTALRLAEVCQDLGDSATALQALDDAAAFHAAAPMPAFFDEIIAGINCAVRAAHGQWAAAIPFAQAALAARGPVQLRNATRRWWQTEALLRAGGGPAAQADVTAFLAAAADTPRLAIAAHRAAAVCARWEGDIAGVRTHLEAARAGAIALDLPGELWSIAADLGACYQAAGVPGAAQAAWNQAATILRGIAAGLDAPLRAGFLRAPQVQAALAAAA
jgi:hypothetical protein